ncbi:type II toxin-antitoxin system HicB family antitoxin [[Haemophilus] ducreyi]|uniref:HicB protein n=1 Tax=Haemophilus ducreyi (strain 35000HP / ATCC 700724) TaxID=233412 RepID=Q7VMR2_HAEDU|nr:type II toxin-antitoxin system HicB family antitoxin [[Haemophilus] ducreyi]AAP95794.1 HicB protein [[Haemophilus] ducreyi 35000HP]ASE07610.1 type II toxin-antitoxin system HicB family antitoxin [[Haemophilus] ducreyi]
MSKAHVLEYKGFIGSIEYSLEDNILYGKILYINGLFTYEAQTIEELRKEFHSAVDDYIEFCQEQGIETCKSFSGNFNVRITPELHKKASLLATKQGLALNAFVYKAIENEVLSYEREVSTVYQYMQNSISTTMAIVESNIHTQVNKSISFSLFEDEVQYSAGKVTIS